MGTRRLNGTGCIQKFKDERKKPYWAYISIKGPDKNGVEKIKKKGIGFFKTKREANDALKAHKEILLEHSEILLETVMDEYVDKIITLKGKESWAYKNAKTYRNQFKSLEDKELCNLKYKDFQNILDKKPYCQQSKLINYVRNLYKLAIKNDYTNIDVSAKLENTATKKPKQEKTILSVPEIQKLWDIYHNGPENDVRWARSCLIILYSGIRIGEYMDLKVKNVFLDENYLLVEKAKTVNGIRKVVIREEIKPLLQYLIDNRHIGNPNYINDRNEKIGSASMALSRFMRGYGINHTVHELRHTFLSKAYIQGLNWGIVEKHAGHKLGNVGIDEYVHLSVKKMLREINKIDFFLEVDDDDIPEDDFSD